MIKITKTFITVLILFFSSYLFAKNTDLENYISSVKKKQFEYDYQKNKVDSSFLGSSWIAPINLNYSYSKSNPTDRVQKNQTAAIRINQPIFQSGGIFYGIKYANALKKYTDYSVDIAQRKMVKDVISLLMQIKQFDLRIQRQELQIENSKINLEQKKEQYLNGQLDSGFLDTAIIERNFKIQSLYDMQTTKERLVSSFSTLSELSYSDLKIPYLELLSQEEFLKHNLTVKMVNAKIDTDSYNKDMRIAKYLPRVSLIAGYNWNKTEAKTEDEKDYYDYGVQLNIPLNINTFRDIESAKIVHLKSKVLKEDKIIQLNSIFEQVMQNISNLEKKQNLSIENIELYSKLLKDTKKLFKAGYKTEYDVSTLENSLNISELDSKIYEIDKQLELLTLYEIYVNDGEKNEIQ